MAVALALTGSASTHFHFHLIVLDGVFSRPADGEVRFHEAALLQSEHWHELQHVVQRRVLRYCARPPFALERLYAPGGIVSLNSPESKLVYRLPTKGGVPKPAPDGRTELVLSPLQLLGPWAVAPLVAGTRTRAGVTVARGIDTIT